MYCGVLTIPNFPTLAQNNTLCQCIQIDNLFPTSNINSQLLHASELEDGQLGITGLQVLIVYNNRTSKSHRYIWLPIVRYMRVEIH